MGKVLVTGANGLIGSRLVELLLRKGYEVNTLDRTARNQNKTGLQSYAWQPDKGIIDEKALEEINAIIHLAGAGIADKRWTDERKKEIIDSRVKSAGLIYDKLKQNKGSVKVFISPSGIDHYGDTGAELVTEDHAPGSGFLAEVTRQWEESTKQFAQLGIREVRCRTALVLAKEGGALPELAKTLPYGVAPYFAKTPLYYSWVHILDICGILVHAIENEQVQGAYNTIAPQPLPMKDMIREVVKAKRSNAILAPVPPFALRLMLGEQAEMLLGSHNCSSAKIEATGFRFLYPDIQSALKEIYT